MATAYAVFSAMGPDRVGIVDELSGLLSERGGNIEESRMAVLGSEFAVMMLVSMDAAQLEGLRSRIPELEARFGLTVVLKPTGSPELAQGGRPYLLETISLDGSGIVHAVSSVLHRMGINIENMETETQSAPLTGAPMFRMKASIILGPHHSVAALKREFDRLEAAQDLDISLRPLVPARPE
ncbi:MAG TPA: ACT domain-containing protein [Rectinemataceae bacterium]|nr:ACT domain-containing protein [Rectinemataceae bacterium]